MEVDNLKEITERESILEKVFCYFCRFGLPRFISAQIVGIIIYILWQGIIYAMTGESDIFDFKNIFFFRDLSVILFVLPYYIFFLGQLKKNIREVSDYVDLPKQDVIAIFNNFFKKLFSNKRFTVVGAIFSSYYFVLTTVYVIVRYYSVAFYVSRLVAVMGLFFFGGFLYQFAYIAKFFLTHYRRIPLRREALDEVMLQVFVTGVSGSTAWFIVLLIMMLLPIVLGFNPHSLLWYITFDGTIFLVGASFFVIFTYVYHYKRKEMQKEEIIKSRL